VPYLGDEVERDHVSWLCGDGARSKLELVVGCYGDHHGCSRCCQALGERRIDDVGE
jgi:hypothetical protein